MQFLDLPSDARNLTGIYQWTFAVGLDAELIQAQVIGPSLEDREVDLAQRGLQCLCNAGKVSGNQLTLQRNRRCRHDDRGIRFDGMRDRRNKVSHRLARSGTSLYRQMLLHPDRFLDGGGHPRLAIAPGTSHRGNDGVE